MSYDPPEWRDRGTSGREGWPSYGGGGNPGAPRSHRHRHEEWDEDGPTTDTGIDRRQFEHVRRLETEARRIPAERFPAPLRPTVHVFERDPEGLPRWALWLGMVRDVVWIGVGFAFLWAAGVLLAHGGVPLWMPK